MKHLLGTKNISYFEALAILDTAEDMAATANQEVKKLPALRGKTVVNLFYENSTRTRISFEAAAKRLSADVINFTGKDSSVTKGESLVDSVKTLVALGVDGIVIRHPSSGSAQFLAQQDWLPASVVNAGDGTNEHPTQALLDAFTMRRHFFGAENSRAKDLQGKEVIIVGDILHSRVARSNIWLLALLGASVTLVAPPTLMPIGIQNWPVKAFYNLDQALAAVAPDAIMMLRIQQERMQDSFFPTAGEYSTNWGLSSERFKKLPEHTIVMHPGPMNRGLEISAEAADSDRAVILDQVTNGVYIRMAALYLTLSSAGANKAGQAADLVEEVKK